MAAQRLAFTDHGTVVIIVNRKEIFAIAIYSAG